MRKLILAIVVVLAVLLVFSKNWFRPIENRTISTPTAVATLVPPVNAPVSIEPKNSPVPAKYETPDPLNSEEAGSSERVLEKNVKEQRLEEIRKEIAPFLKQSGENVVLGDESIMADPKSFRTLSSEAERQLSLENHGAFLRYRAAKIRVEQGLSPAMPKEEAESLLRDKVKDILIKKEQAAHGE